MKKICKEIGANSLMDTKYIAFLDSDAYPNENWFLTQNAVRKRSSPRYNYWT